MSDDTSIQPSIYVRLAPFDARTCTLMILQETILLLILSVNIGLNKTSTDKLQQTNI